MGQPKRSEKGEPKPSNLEPVAPVERWEKPAGLSPRGWAVVAAVAVVINLPVIHYYLLRGRPEASAQVPFRDDFSDFGTVERNYFSTGGHWRVVEGELLSPGVKNNPLWLKAKLPENVAVDFDVRSASPEGDIKCEIFGDGSDHASGYVLIHGGWNNSLSVIARLDEHGQKLERLRDEANRKGGDWVATGVFQKDTHMRVEANPYPVQLNRTYHWRIERRGSLLRWSIDQKPFMEFNDPFPLKGPDHDRFAFSSWESQLYFDNLVIQPL